LRFYIPDRRLTEEAFVFAGELTRALISDVESGPCGIDILDEHFLSRTHQSKLFVILQGAQGSCRPEVMVYRRDHHARNSGEFFETKGFRAPRDCA
jgi:hypothetical protein